MSEKEKTKEIIKDTLIEKGANYVALFGSFARGEEKENSDIDVLVNFEPAISLYTHIGIEMHLTEKLGKKIDLVTVKGLSKHLSPYIKNDLITLYEKR